MRHGTGLSMIGAFIVHLDACGGLRRTQGCTCYICLSFFFRYALFIQRCPSFSVSVFLCLFRGHDIECFALFHLPYLDRVSTSRFLGDQLICDDRSFNPSPINRTPWCHFPDSTAFRSKHLRREDLEVLRTMQVPARRTQSLPPRFAPVKDSRRHHSTGLFSRHSQGACVWYTRGAVAFDALVENLIDRRD